VGVITVNVKVRPRPKKTVTRRRLHGNARASARAAKKFLTQALNHDGRILASGGDVASADLIFLGDTGVMAKVQSILDTLDDALSSSLKIVRSR